MEWNWLSFVLGVLVGTLLMWLATVVAQAGGADNEERWR